MTLTSWTLEAGRKAPIVPTRPESNRAADQTVPPFLENISSGFLGAGGKMVMWNRGPQWTGDYLGNGFQAIVAQMANFGPGDLFMGIGISDTPTTFPPGCSGNCFVSPTIFLPPDGQWQNVAFSLLPSDLIPIGATTVPADQVLQNVAELRILSSPTGPSWQGDIVASQLGVDNLGVVLSNPAPSASSGALLGAFVLAITDADVYEETYNEAAVVYADKDGDGDVDFDDIDAFLTLYEMEQSSNQASLATAGDEPSDQERNSVWSLDEDWLVKI